MPKRRPPGNVPAIAAADRKADFHIGIKGPGRGKSPLPGGRYERDGTPSRYSKTIRKGVVRRVSQVEKHRRFIARRYEFEEGPP
jgi:hypothetical protein